MQLFYQKSCTFRIHIGTHWCLEITLRSLISCIAPTNVIKYLGTNFNDEIIADETNMLQQLRKQVERHVSTPLLNQKFNIINDYIWPTIIFPFQQAPLSKLPMTLLADVDKILKFLMLHLTQWFTPVKNSKTSDSSKQHGKTSFNLITPAIM